MKNSTHFAKSPKAKISQAIYSNIFFLKFKVKANTFILTLALSSELFKCNPSPHAPPWALKKQADHRGNGVDWWWFGRGGYHSCQDRCECFHLNQLLIGSNCREANKSLIRLLTYGKERRGRGGKKRGEREGWRDGERNTERQKLKKGMLLRYLQLEWQRGHAHATSACIRRTAHIQMHTHFKNF